MQIQSETSLAAPVFTLDEVRKLVSDSTQEYGAYRDGQHYFQKPFDSQLIMTQKEERFGTRFRMYKGDRLRELLGGKDWLERIQKSGVTHGLGGLIEDSGKNSTEQRYFLGVETLERLEKQATAHRHALCVQVKRLRAVAETDDRPHRRPELVIGEHGFYNSHEELSQGKPLREHLKLNGITFIDEIIAAASGRMECKPLPELSGEAGECGSFRLVFLEEKLKAYEDSLGAPMKHADRYAEGHGSARAGHTTAGSRF